MNKRPLLIDIALNGQLKAVLNHMAFPDFEERSACEGEDLEIFFSEISLEIKRAKEICSSCPVRAMCADWGVKYENYGVWGGLSAKERLLMRGGREAINPADLLEAAQNYQLIMSSPLEEVSSLFKVSERTIIRWKGILRQVA
jgi:WhiB family redox-sensing transcriptional regulator